MKVLGIIPARGGSKGVPGKNIKILGNKPLLQYTAEAALKSSLLTDIIISTDNEDIAVIARKCGIEVPFIRPAALATDTASSIDVVIHAIEFLEQQARFYDAICLLQPTNPFRSKGLIDSAIEKFFKSGTDSLISVLPVPHEFNPHWLFEINTRGTLVIATGEKEIIRRRQDLPTAYYRDGSIYLTKTKVLLQQRSFYGESVAYIESNPVWHVNIDTLKDWETAQNLCKKFDGEI
jgi:CMP-N-acetylneuraminic acid synthetase